LRFVILGRFAALAGDSDLLLHTEELRRLSVVTFVKRAKMAEPIEMSFGMLTRVDTRGTFEGEWVP